MPVPLDGERVGARGPRRWRPSPPPFTPWMSATTVMIDDTATMLPSSVSIDRSLLAQIDASASLTDSQNLLHARSVRTTVTGGGAGRVLAHRIAVEQVAHRVERAGDHPVAFLQTRQHLEVALAGDADLDWHELGLAVADAGTRLRLPRACARAAARSGSAGAVCGAGAPKLRSASSGGTRLAARRRPARRTPARARSAPGSARPPRCSCVAVVISAVQVKPGTDFGELPRRG